MIRTRTPRYKVATSERSRIFIAILLCYTFVLVYSMGTHFYHLPVVQTISAPHLLSLGVFEQCFFCLDQTGYRCFKGFTKSRLAEG